MFIIHDAYLFHVTGSTIFFSGIDIIDGTPILDIKPYIPQYDIPASDDGDGGKLECSLSDTFSLNAEKSDPDDKSQIATVLEDTDVNDLPTSTIWCMESEGDERGGIEVSADNLSIIQSIEMNDKASCARNGDFSELFNVCNLNSSNELCSDTRFDFHLTDTVLLPVNNMSRDRHLMDISDALALSDDTMPNSRLIKHANVVNEPGDRLMRERLYNGCCEEFSRTENSEQPCQICSASGAVYIPRWLTCPPVPKLTVTFTPTAVSQLHRLVSEIRASHADNNSSKVFLSSEVAIRSALFSVLSEDPRSVYRRRKCSDMLYFFVVDHIHVTCWFDSNRVEVLKLQFVSPLSSPVSEVKN